MTDTNRTTSGSQTRPGRAFAKAASKVASVLVKPRAIFAIALAGVLTVGALLMALISINGNQDNPIVKALSSYAGYTRLRRAYRCPSYPPSGSFLGCYYNYNEGSGYGYFETFKSSRNDAAIDFDWGTGSPSAYVAADRFSATWEGWFYFEGGDYQFTVKKDDGMRAYLDNSLIFDQYTSGSQTDFTFTKNILKGNHIVKVEYYDATGPAVAKFSWAKPGIPPVGADDPNQLLCERAPQIFTDATATKSLTTNPPKLAIDNNTSTFWNSGDYAPQGIKFDLGSNKNIAKLCLRVAQQPEGLSKHEFYIPKVDGMGEVKIGTLEKALSTSKWEIFEVPAVYVNFRSLKITSIASPSWIAWTEVKAIEVTQLPVDGGTGGGGSGTTTTPAASWTGETYKVVSYCSDTDPGKAAVLSAKGNVPFGIKLTEGSYSPLFPGGSYVALFETPDTTGGYGGSFTVLAKNISPESGITFRLYQLSTMQEIGSQYLRVNRHDDCATYSLVIDEKITCTPDSPQVGITADIKNAESGRRGYVKVLNPAGVISTIELKEETTGNYHLSASLLPRISGQLTVELYFNDYLRSKKTIAVPTCGPTGTIYSYDANPTICSGQTKNITVYATANRVGTVADVQNNILFALSDPEKDGIFNGSAVVTMGPNPKTFLLTLLDTGAVPVSGSQLTVTPNQNGCAASATLTAPAQVQICTSEAAQAVTVSATATVPARIFVNGINYTNARVSGMASLTPSGSFNASLGAGGASTIYTVTVVNDSGQALASQQIDIQPKTCAQPLELTSAQGFTNTCGYNNYQATSGKYLVLWGKFPATGITADIGGTRIGNLSSSNGNQINVPLTSVRLSYPSLQTIRVSYQNSSGQTVVSNPIEFLITPSLPYISAVQGYDPQTGMYTDGYAERGKYLVVWGNFCPSGNSVYVNGAEAGYGLTSYNGNQLNALLPQYLPTGQNSVTVMSSEGSAQSFVGIR